MGNFALSRFPFLRRRRRIGIQEGVKPRKKGPGSFKPHCQLQQYPQLQNDNNQFYKTSVKKAQPLFQCLLTKQIMQ
jgi:hypothetical protein